MDYFIVAALLFLPGPGGSLQPPPAFPCPPLLPSARLQDLLKDVLSSSARAYSHALSVREAVTAAAFHPGQSYEEYDLLMEG